MNQSQTPELTAGQHNKEQGDKVKAIFSELAPKYRRFNQISSFGLFLGWQRALVQEAKKQPFARYALDVAAGTGDISFELARNLKLKQIEVTDFCKEMLDLAEQEYRIKADTEFSDTLFHFSVQDAQDLQFEDESFDLVTVAYGLRNFPNRQQAMSEALRVLRPGGSYLILEFSRPPARLWRFMYHIYLRFFIPRIGKLVLGKRESFDYFKDSILQFPPQEELAAELKACGFKSVRYKNLAGGIVALHSAIK